MFDYFINLLYNIQEYNCGYNRKVNFLWPKGAHE